MSAALTFAVHALMREASERAILPRYRTLAAHEIVTKSEKGTLTDLVTIADGEAEAILSEGLARLLPEAAIVGEEAAHADPAVFERLGDALCWIVGGFTTVYPDGSAMRCAAAARSSMVSGSPHKQPA